MTDDVMTQLAAARTNPSIIMVVGVGGAGGNAVNHMWNLGIKGVDFMVCNTDQQALDKSPVELKVRLGSEGLGAGNDPENGRKAASSRSMWCASVSRRRGPRWSSSLPAWAAVRVRALRR